jgi:hypothetical protein
VGAWEGDDEEKKNETSREGTLRYCIKKEEL